MKGQRSCCPAKIVDFLSRFFFVVLLNEYNTSKKCPNCEQDLTLKPRQKGYRLWICLNGCLRSDGKGVLEVNKDKSAGLCFFKIVVHLVAFGERPSNFSKN